MYRSSVVLRVKEVVLAAPLFKEMATLAGAVVSEMARVIVSEKALEILLAASLNQTYTCFKPFPELRVKFTVVLKLVADETAVNDPADGVEEDSLR